MIKKIESTVNIDKSLVDALNQKWIMDYYKSNELLLGLTMFKKLSAMTTVEYKKHVYLYHILHYIDRIANEDIAVIARLLVNVSTEKCFSQYLNKRYVDLLYANLFRLFEYVAIDNVQPLASSDLFFKRLVISMITHSTLESSYADESKRTLSDSLLKKHRLDLFANYKENLNRVTNVYDFTHILSVISLLINTLAKSKHAMPKSQEKILAPFYTQLLPAFAFNDKGVKSASDLGNANIRLFET